MALVEGGASCKSKRRALLRRSTVGEAIEMANQTGCVLASYVKTLDMRDGTQLSGVEFGKKIFFKGRAGGRPNI